MSIVLSSFFVNNTATSEIYTLSLRDALPIYKGTPTVLTTLHNASGGASVANGSKLDLNSSLHDTAAVTATDGLSAGGGTLRNPVIRNSQFSNIACSNDTGIQHGTQITTNSPL